ncbi:MAG: hypothetical protein FJ288_05005 [Planctomycetes bacterium]|nr:hypothetical protein [Planctomycetota bacterium]
MRQLAAVAAVMMITIGAGWAAAAVLAGEAAAPAQDKSPAAPVAKPVGGIPDNRPPAPIAKPVGAEPEKQPPAPIAKPVGPVPAKPPPAPPAKPAGAEPAKPSAPGAVTPPPPVPDVEIPPIPEVGDDPFKPGPGPVRKKKADVIDEGKRLFDREGRLEVDPLGRPLFIFDGGEKPMPVLENAVREMLEAATDHGKRKARWRISGIVTVYEGRNFILITRATRILPEEENL